MRSRGLAGNHCLFVVAVEGRLDVSALLHRIERATTLLPELRRELVLSPAGPYWREAPSPRAELRVRSIDDADLGSTLEALVDQRVGPERPWAATLLRAKAGDVFVWHWFHPLSDAKGAERFVTWLGGGGASGPSDPPPAEERSDSGTRPLAKLDRKARLDLTRAYGNHMLKLARKPIVSLTSLGGKLGRTRTLRVQLSQDETSAFDARVRQRAKLAETSVMVLVATRLFDAIVGSRGLAPAQHLIPVPLSLDPKAFATRLFGNNLTMMTFSLGRDDLADLGRAIASLADQQRAIVKEKLDTGMLASLDFAKVVPAGPYHWFLTRPFGGEVSSFVFSNPGAVTLSTFADLAVRDAFALPSVAAPPGFQVIFSRHGGRLSAFIGFAEGLLWPAEERALAQLLRAELLGF